MQNTEPEGKRLVSNQTMEVVTAVFFLTVSAIFISDALRLGIGWNFDGPAAGYFPFYIACVMGISSLINLFSAFANKEESGETFVTTDAFVKVLQVLVPLAIYIFAIGYVGIYVASTVYIALFMFFIGKYTSYMSLLVGAAVSFFLFMMFEVWFLTPLPKGPLEAAFGY